MAIREPIGCRARRQTRRIRCVKQRLAAVGTVNAHGARIRKTVAEEPGIVIQTIRTRGGRIVCCCQIA